MGLAMIAVATASYLLASGSLHGWALVTTVVLLVFFSAAAIVALLLLFHRRLRRRTLFVLANSAHWLLHRFVPARKPGRMRIWRFQRNLNRGIEFMLARKTHMALPAFYIFIDWVVTLGILYGAFLALHYPIPFTFVVVGFAVGTMIVKETRPSDDPSTWTVYAMVKRDDAFNPGSGCVGWELVHPERMK